MSEIVKFSGAQGIGGPCTTTAAIAAVALGSARPQVSYEDSVLWSAASLAIMHAPVRRLENHLIYRFPVQLLLFPTGAVE